MDVLQKEQFLQSEYGRLKKYQYSNNSQILFNIILAKRKFDMLNYKNSLYIDVKRFVKSYVVAADNLDYGYDEIRLDKIKTACECLLERREQLSVYYTTRRLFYLRGYDCNVISFMISKLECRIAWDEKKYFKSVRLFVGLNFYALIIAYAIYAFIIFMVLQPAPIEIMELFSIELKEYSNNPTVNCLINSLAILTGNDTISPQIIPNGFVGMALYCIGIFIFYVLIVNFIFKKLEDFITLK